MQGLRSRPDRIARWRVTRSACRIRRLWDGSERGLRFLLAPFLEGGWLASVLLIVLAAAFGMGASGLLALYRSKRLRETSLCTSCNAALGRVAELLEARDAAAGVLHNVANALTTVSAGVALGSQRLESIPTLELERAIQSMEDRKGLRAFLRGLAEEHAELRAELAMVQTASDHAVELIRAHQTLARRPEASVSASVIEVIEDAIHISRAARHAREVTIRRDFDGDFIAIVDRHRMVEILVNLLNNAIDALLTVTRPEKHIVIGLRRRQNSFEIWIADNGPGIPAEAHDKIFTYGYSTKPHGHGLGLHSSWGAANDIGGWLRLEPSPERGAAFSLILPLRTPTNVPDALHTTTAAAEVA